MQIFHLSFQFMIMEMREICVIMNFITFDSFFLLQLIFFIAKKRPLEEHQSEAQFKFNATISSCIWLIYPWNIFFSSFIFKLRTFATLQHQGIASE